VSRLKKVAAGRFSRVSDPAAFEAKFTFALQNKGPQADLFWPARFFFN